MRKQAAYNLTCFNQLYKDNAEESGIDFQDLYLAFARETDPYIRKTIAASIHEAFRLCNQDEDTFRLREALKLLLEEKATDSSGKDILIAMVDNIHLTIKSYGNEHGIKAFTTL